MVKSIIIMKQGENKMETLKAIFFFIKCLFVTTLICLGGLGLESLGMNFILSYLLSCVAWGLIKFILF